MSLDSYVTEIEHAAEAAAFHSKAVYRCPAHPSVSVRTENYYAERYARALMTLMWERRGGDDDRELWIDALGDCLGQATDGCPACEICAAA